MEHFLGDKGFQEVLDDSHLQQADQVTDIMVCQGQIYYDLQNRRDSLQSSQSAIVRLEQITPFPYHQLQEVLSRYPSSAKVTFVQEEH